MSPKDSSDSYPGIISNSKDKKSNENTSTENENEDKNNNESPEIGVTKGLSILATSFTMIGGLQLQYYIRLNLS